MLISPLNIFKEAAAVYKANYKIFLQTIAWLLGAAILLTILNITDRQTAFKYLSYTFPAYLILSALSFVIGLWTQIVLIRLVNAGLSKEAVDKKTLRQNAWRDTAPFLWVSLLTGLIILGGTILFIIPGLIFTVWFFFSMYIFAIEGARGYGALKKSKDLAQGRFWPIAWRVVVPALFYGLLLIITIGVPTLIIGYFTKFAGFTSNLSLVPWWFDAWQSIVTVAALPLSLAMWVILYRNLKENPVAAPRQEPPVI